MQDLWQRLNTWLTPERFDSLLTAIALVVIGYALAKLLRSILDRLARTRLSAQHSILLGRITFYLVFALAIISALREVGVDFSLLVGAAGILTVALGFASQTSVSNIISGLFLIGEKPFEIGDTVRIGTTTGEVLSIDLLSVRLRTFDNLLVRIPNENLLKAEITNLTRYPIRRIDLLVGVAYRQDLVEAEKVLRAVAAANPLLLDEPHPRLFILAFGQSSIDLQFSVWATRENFVDLKTAFYREVKQAFDSHGIEIPFPQRVVTFAGGSGPTALDTGPDSAPGQTLD